MTLKKNAITGGLAAMMVMVMTAGAFAWSAHATTTLNVRSGPGTNFRVVDTLRGGERVHVEYCRGSWCFVDKSGPNGWVSQSYLRQGSYRPAPPPVYRPAPPRPPVYRPGPPRPPHYWDRPNRPPHWRDDHRRPPHYRPGPGRPNTGGQVCFNGPNGYVCIGN